jgi:hypothetical protein
MERLKDEFDHRASRATTESAQETTQTESTNVAQPGGSGSVQRKAYAVKSYSAVKEVVIHLSTCSFARDEGKTSKDGKLIWRHFDTLDGAIAWGRSQARPGYKFKHCSFCKPDGEGAAIPI